MLWGLRPGSQPHAYRNPPETVRQQGGIIVIGVHRTGQQMSVVAFALPKLLREVDGVPVAAQVVPVTGVADGRPDAILLPSENEVPDARVGTIVVPLTD